MTRRQRLSAAPGQGPASQGGPEPEIALSESQAPFLASQPVAAGPDPRLPEPRLSAQVGGKKTNRVKMRSAGKAMNQYRQDPSVRGMDTVVVAISIPAGELAEMDAFAARVQMARSHLIRQAVKHFRVKVLG